jgi:hypothetical protein
MYPQPFERQQDYQSEAVQYDPTQPQPQQNYYDEQIHAGLSENNSAPHNYNFPGGGYPQQSYAGYAGQNQNPSPEMGKNTKFKI